MQQNKPRLIFWELTKHCNLNCIHCRAEPGEEHDSQELSLDEVKSTVDNISKHFSPIMVLTGGEPLYRNDLFEIATYISEKKLPVALATNGTLIDKVMSKEIMESGISRVSISLDGSSAQVHDRVRGIEGSFMKALEGIEHLKKENVSFQINMTITQQTAQDLDGVVHLAKSLEAAALHLFMLVPVGCGMEIADKEMLSSSEIEILLNEVYDITKKTDLEIKATCAPHYYRIIRQRAQEEGRKLSFETDGMSAMTRGCLAGSGVAFISHVGDVQPCGYLPVKAGNVREESFSDIWNKSPLFESLRDVDNLTGKCGACEYKIVCAGCRARAFYESDIMGEEPYCEYIPRYFEK